ncbi:mandelate racemase/muconate lactonizing enzyme family protein [Cohnella boryungensis]|uniref:Dipeptide epimerase n=1 Tax=Cohnella boryungensis TaxID=768479 RepID=A0ABV8SCE7_9BACL
MIIRDIAMQRIVVPLRKPFKTALRTLESATSLIISITDEDGRIGYGEAPPTLAITGEQLEGIEAFIHSIKPRLIGLETQNTERVFELLHKGTVRNSSAKAALDMAIYDLSAQQAGLPLYKYLGGYRSVFKTDCTVSVNSPEEMGEDAAAYVREGFDVLKLKVGVGDVELDIARVKEIRKRIGNEIKLRLDANQGWSVKESIRAIRAMEDAGLNIELVEQPVPAFDVTGLEQVTRAVDTPIMADESVFSPQDAMKLLSCRAADLINIKLMKAGGIHHALTLNRMAEACGVECMIGSMIETRVGITAAAHFAGAMKNVTRFDLDSPLLMSSDPIRGGIRYEGATLFLSDSPGLGIEGLV